MVSIEGKVCGFSTTWCSVWNNTDQLILQLDHTTPSIVPLWCYFVKVVHNTFGLISMIGLIICYIFAFGKCLRLKDYSQGCGGDREMQSGP